MIYDDNIIDFDVRIECNPEKNIHYWIYWLRGPGPGPSSYKKCAICGNTEE